MRFLSRLNRPWLHFIILGAALFYAKNLFYPPPKPVIGPLSEARVEALRQQWFTSAGQLPTPAQQARMITAELDRDMLFQRAIELNLHRYDTVVYQRLLRNMRFLQLDEGKTDQQLYEQALAMRLHLGDVVVKRRLIQVMEQLLLAANPPREPTEQDLVAEFERRREELRVPPRYTLEHLYFAADEQDKATAAIAAIRQQHLTIEQARPLGSPFLPGYKFINQTPDQLTRHFGSTFVNHLQAAGPVSGHWLGPVQSTYGEHYVWIEEVEPAREAKLDEVRRQLLRDLQYAARDEALNKSIKAMRKRYEVRR